jgi:hypothetical protein
MGTFYSRTDLVLARAQWKAAGKVVVLTNDVSSKASICARDFSPAVLRKRTL